MVDVILYAACFGIGWALSEHFGIGKRAADWIADRLGW